MTQTEGRDEIKSASDERQHQTGDGAASEGLDDASLDELLSLLRAELGRELSVHRQGFVARQLMRRMRMGALPERISDLTDLRQHPDKIAQLAAELLADSLSFLYDSKLLAAVESSVVPGMFTRKNPEMPIRIWVPGCASGMAAYAIARLVYECAQELEDRRPIQIFATESDQAAIAIARRGWYLKRIAKTVPSEQLQRFLDEQDELYRVKKPARDLVIFAVHDPLRDPPFTHLDLIVCENLLGASEPSAQEQLLRIFHYCLRPNGLLALGLGEQASFIQNLFAEASDLPRVFQRCNVAQDAPSPTMPLLDPYPQPLSPIAQRSYLEQATSIKDLHLRLLAKHAAPSILLDETFTIRHLIRPAQGLFEIPEGPLSRNALDIIIGPLRSLLRAALNSAARKGRQIETQLTSVPINGATWQIRMLVNQLDEPAWARGYFLVIFDKYPEQPADDLSHGAGATLTTRRPEVDMSSGRQWWPQLDDYERAIEGQLKANVQLQETNEKLTIVTEELRASQEQLATVNKELQVSNQELRRRVIDLTRANNDLSNLISATDIATIFLDTAMQITRFTPAAQDLFNLIPADRGRPLAHVTHTLDYDRMLADTTQVMKTLQPIDREIRGQQGSWYLARVRAYRTVDEQIDGVVLTFVDITTRKLAEEVLRRARDQLELRVAERTQELRVANVQLRTEVDERTRLEGERLELLHKIVTLQEDERRRIARELHDQLGQSVSALGIGLGILANSAMEAEQRQQTLARLRELAVQIDKDMNRLALDLRPTALDDVGLAAAVQYHIERWSEHNHIQVEYQVGGLMELRLPSQVESVIYRVIQEALTNIAKHAAAQRVSIILELRNKQASLIVEDNGRGFDLDALQQAGTARQRLGLLGMQERVALVGGSFTIDTTPGVGTAIFARIPIEQGAT